MSLILSIYLWSLSDSLWARSLKATADKLSQEASNVGIAIAIFGIIVAGIYLVLGRNDASTKMTSALLGTLVVMIAPTIVGFVKTLA
ncbi:MAG: hypothetical protein K2P81_00450 [Bacteriovoracaceae bacterium]|jgi:type IV secretory pathway VirB2 component (pilin)|nr:hypothetical protein [Bacteriovoracaceae bacterium]